MSATSAEKWGTLQVDRTDRPAAGAGLWSREGFRPFLIILSVFWAYVALSNILYANSMRASLEALSLKHIFAPWDARLLQHLVLYPFFMGAVWLSMRLKWRPLWRALPLQLACGLVFAALGSPAMMLAEQFTGGGMTSEQHGMPPFEHFLSGPDLAIWAASMVTMLLTYFFALALVTGFAMYRRLRDTQLRSAALERELAAAHLAALRMQLSPHTLFNLLHTIRGQIGWDPAAAQSMVVKLGDLLRRLLRAGEREHSLLAQELEFARLYLELQRQRFSDRLTVELPDPSALPACWLPSLMLHPLIENAVVHGLAGHERTVTVRVEVAVDAEELRLRVSNDFAPGRRGGEPGIGLQNVRERLAIQFGERATLSSGPVAGEHWKAELRLPLLREGPAGPGAA